MKTLLLILSFIAGSTAFAVTPDNDASCDIAVLPAATLLLPYFEVSEPWWDRRVATTTRFSITNVTNLEQIAQVTIWTDRGYPVLSLNVHLPGYDVESIDLYDVLMRAVVVRSPPSLRHGRDSDPNAGVDVSGCSTNMYMPLDVPIQELIWLAFDGKSPSLDGRAVASPNNHSRGKFAAGYVTIDVVDSCTSFTPADDRYWREALRYDNVLVGDYQQIDVENGSAVDAEWRDIRLDVLQPRSLPVRPVGEPELGHVRHRERRGALFDVVRPRRSRQRLLPSDAGERGHDHHERSRRHWTSTEPEVRL